MEIVDYSERSFVLLGDTKAHKDIIKEMGGKWNPSLSCGSGWIFSKKNQDNVEKWMSELDHPRNIQEISYVEIMKENIRKCFPKSNYKKMYITYARHNIIHEEIDEYFDNDIDKLNALFFDFISSLHLDYRSFLSIDRAKIIEFSLISLFKDEK